MNQGRNSFLIRYYQGFILFKEWTIPLFLLILSFLTHGLLIPELGLYWEDWQFLWTFHSLGQSGLREWFSGDRWFSGWIYGYMLQVMGESQFPYLVMSIIFHWISSVLFWWILLGVFPTKRRLALISSLLFVVYPGIILHPIAILYTMYFFHYSLFLFSIGAMVWAIRIPRWSFVLTILSLISAFLSLLINEYFVGLELLRPILIWTILSEEIDSFWKRFFEVGKKWSPYMVILSLYSYWRIFIYKPWIYDATEFMSTIKDNPYTEIIKRLQYAFADVITVGLIAWEGILQEDMFAFYYPFILIWVLIFFGTGLTYIYLSNFKESIPSDIQLSDKSERLTQAFIIGVIAMFLGGLPVWFADRHLNLWGISNRLVLPFMLGASLFMAGFLLILLKTRRQQLIIMSLLIGFSVGFHLRNANNFRHDWMNQRSIFWQLAWRAPVIAPGTALIFLERPSWLTNGAIMSAQVNFIYGSRQRSRDLDYWVFELTRRGRKGEIEVMQSDWDIFNANFKKGIQLIPRYPAMRTWRFKGSTSKALVVWQSPSGCLRILDNSYNGIPHLPALGRVAQKISNVEVIKVNYDNQSSPQMRLFQPEPDHGWCYYFQKADLERQRKNWEEVVKLGDEAFQKGLSPQDVTELIPFIEGYQRLGRNEDAKKLLEITCKDGLPHERPALCE